MAEGGSTWSDTTENIQENIPQDGGPPVTSPPPSSPSYSYPSPSRGALRPRRVCGFCGMVAKDDKSSPDIEQAAFDCKHAVDKCDDQMQHVIDSLNEFRGEITSDLVQSAGERFSTLENLLTAITDVDSKLNHVTMLLGGSGLESRIQTVANRTYKYNYNYRCDFFDALPLNSACEVGGFFGDYTKVLDATRYFFTQTPIFDEKGIERIHRVMLSDEFTLKVRWLRDINHNYTTDEVPAVYKRFIVSLVREAQSAGLTSPKDINVHAVCTRFFPHSDEELNRIPPPPLPERNSIVPSSRAETQLVDAFPAGEESEERKLGASAARVKRITANARFNHKYPRAVELCRIIDVLHGREGEVKVRQQLDRLLAKFPDNSSLDTAYKVVAAGMPKAAMIAMVEKIDADVHLFPI